MPKVSVVVPNYNHASFLTQRIESIILQSYTDYELIILDDASSDDSHNVIKRYANNSKVTRVVYNTENSGSPFAQWKCGVDLASGEYIWIAESDDWAETTFLEKLVSILDNNPKIGLVYSDSIVHGENAETTTFSKLNNAFDQSKKWSSKYSTTGHKELEKMAYFCTINNVSAVLFRKEALLDIQLPTDFRFMGDWYVYVQIAVKGWYIAYSNEILNNYRYHANNTTKKSYCNLHYVYERFILANFIINNCAFINKSAIKNNLYEYTISSILSMDDVLNVYRKCVQVNRKLAVAISCRYLMKLYKIRIKEILSICFP